MISAYVLFSYIRTKYLIKYKWKDVVLHIATLLLFFILFVIGNKDATSSSQYRIVLMCFISLYFLYKIYQDIKRLRAK